MVASFVRMPRAAAIVGCALIAGCGGGGGGGSGPPQNRTPTLGTVQFSATEDTDLSAQVTATDADGDALSFTRTGDPGKGTVTAFSANGSFTYRPNRDVFGSDSFTVRVADSLGNGVTGTVTIQIAAAADPPTARNDMLTVTAAGLASLDVRGNDLDPDGETLTITIESPAEVGTASVNANGTVAISGLPAGFRGVTRFKYRATDQTNAFSVATAVVFVDITAFRVIFGGDEPDDGSYEMYITDLLSAPVKLTAATQGSLRLRSFAAAANGSTVAYRRADINNAGAPADFFFVRTANPATQVPIQLPAGMTLFPNDSRGDTYVVSPDGQWIAGIASKTPTTNVVIMINVANPTVVHESAGFGSVQQLQFSRDSQYLYFLAGFPLETELSVMRTAIVQLTGAELVSKPPTGSLTDTVTFYSVLADNSKVILQASRNDVTNVYMVDTSNRGTEIRLNHPLSPGDQLTASNVGGTFMFATPDVTRIGYYVDPAVGQVQSYVAEISATPNPRPFGPPGASFAMMRPDNQAALFQSPTQVLEAVVDSAQAATPLCDECFNARYDSRGDAVMAQVDNPPSQTNPEEYLTVAAAVRPTFGTPQQHVGTPDMAAHFANFAGGDRAVVLIGEGPKTLFPAKPAIHMALVNVWAPDKLMYLADFESPIGLRSGRAQFVDP